MNWILRRPVPNSVTETAVYSIKFASNLFVSFFKDRLLFNILQNGQTLFDNIKKRKIPMGAYFESPSCPDISCQNCFEFRLIDQKEIL